MERMIGSGAYRLECFSQLFNLFWLLYRFCLGSMLSQGGLTAIENFPEKFSLEWCGANVIKVTEKVAWAAVCDSKNGGLGLRRHADLNYASVIRHI
jgi:hypothetical protein